MELLRNRAAQNFVDYHMFNDTSASELEAVTCNATASSGEPPTSLNGPPTFEFSTRTLRQDKLLNPISDPKGTESQEPGILKAYLSITILPVLQTEPYREGADISKATFLKLLHSYDIDPYVQYLIQNNVNNLHTIQDGGDNISYTCYVGHTRYKLFWSFKPRTFHTKAVLILRGKCPESAQRALPPFREAIQQLRGRIFSPYALALVVLSDLTEWCDRGRPNGWSSNPELEFSAMLEAWKVKISRTTNYLAETSKIIEATFSRLARLRILNDHAFSLVEALGNMELSGFWFGQENDPRRAICHEAYRRDVKQIQASLGVLRQRVMATRKTLDYMTERTTNGSSLVYALLTHEDARVGMELAEANRNLAEATKQDGAAMKTMAIMTMGFLPGKFLAAVFALPSLQWAADSFWIYWVLTVALTAIVFAIWGILNYDNPVKARVAR